MTSHVIIEFAGEIPEPLLRAQSVAGKFFLMFFAIAAVRGRLRPGALPRVLVQGQNR